MQTEQYCLNNEKQLKIRLDKEIEKFINEYRGFLSHNNIDVAKSTIDNTWFVYRYEKQYGYYEYFIRFSTVSQLIDIILKEMQFELYCAIEKEVDLPECEDGELADMVSEYYSGKDVVPELTVLLDMIIDSELGKNSEFFRLLNKLCKMRDIYK